MEAALLEQRISHRQGFVHNQDVRLNLHLHCEGEPHEHTATVSLHGLFDELPNVRECGDIVKLLVDLRPGQSQDGRVQVNVLAAGELGVEARPQFQQGRDPSVDCNRAGGRLQSTHDDLQQRRFAGAIAAHDPDAFPFAHLERDVLEGEEVFERLVRNALAEIAHTRRQEGNLADLAEHRSVEPRRRRRPDGVALGYVLDPDGNFGAHEYLIPQRDLPAGQLLACIPLKN